MNFTKILTISGCVVWLFWFCFILSGYILLGKDKTSCEDSSHLWGYGVFIFLIYGLLFAGGTCRIIRNYFTIHRFDLTNFLEHSPFVCASILLFNLSCVLWGVAELARNQCYRGTGLYRICTGVVVLQLFSLLFFIPVFGKIIKDSWDEYWTREVIIDEKDDLSVSKKSSSISNPVRQVSSLEPQNTHQYLASASIRNDIV